MSSKTNKGNKTTEIILGSAALKLEAAVKAISGAAEEVAKLDQKAGECTLTVSNLEDKIGGLKQDLANQQAQNKLELELQYKADQKSFIDTWMMQNQCTYLPANELNDLKTRLQRATSEVDQTVAKAVASATNSLNAKYESELTIKDLQYKTSEANNLATIKSLQAEVEIWKQQAISWQKALDAERTAGVERQKASAIGTLNLGGNGK